LQPIAFFLFSKHVEVKVIQKSPLGKKCTEHCA
jgi:hypothetical protein